MLATLYIVLDITLYFLEDTISLMRSGSAPLTIMEVIKMLYKQYYTIRVGSFIGHITAVRYFEGEGELVTIHKDGEPQQYVRADVPPRTYAVIGDELIPTIGIEKLLG